MARSTVSLRPSSNQPLKLDDAKVPFPSTGEGRMHGVWDT